ALAPAASSLASSMESHRLRFDAEGRPIDFSTWQRQATRHLTSQRQDSATLWAHAFGALKAPLPPDPLPTAPEPTPAAQADYDRRVLARDVWDSRDAAAALALTELLPPTEAVHFAQVETVLGIWDAVVARYSTPSSASLSLLLMPFVFPDLGSFAIVILLFPPPMWLIVHWLVTRLLDRLATGPPTGGVQTGGGVGPQQQQPQQNQPQQREQHQQRQQQQKQAPQQFQPWGPPLQWGPQQHWGPPLQWSPGGPGSSGRSSSSSS
ncbi:unnamed protein product, partial [Closterium sp. NIES-54]